MQSTLGVTSTATLYTAARGRVRRIDISNGGTAAAHVKFYDKATAATQADTPIWRICVPAGGMLGFSYRDSDFVFLLGLSVRAVTEAADSGTTSPGTNEVIVNIAF